MFIFVLLLLAVTILRLRIAVVIVVIFIIIFRIRLSRRAVFIGGCFSSLSCKGQREKLFDVVADIFDCIAAEIVFIGLDFVGNRASEIGSLFDVDLFDVGEVEER